MKATAAVLTKLGEKKKEKKCTQDLSLKLEHEIPVRPGIRFTVRYVQLRLLNRSIFNQNFLKFRG
jgi:hypothetical protein